MDVVTAVTTAPGDYTMTTNIEEQATTPATATAREPKATKKANVAPRKPRVAPAKGKSGKKGHPSQEGHQRPQGRQKGESSPRGQQDRQDARPAEAARRSHREGVVESHRLAAAQHPRVHQRNLGEKDGLDRYVHQG